MLHESLLLILALLFAVFLLVMLGQKLGISYPIFLVLGGLVLSFVPGLPQLPAQLFTEFPVIIDDKDFCHVEDLIL